MPGPQTLWPIPCTDGEENGKVMKSSRDVPLQPGTEMDCGGSHDELPACFFGRTTANYCHKYTVHRFVEYWWVDSGNKM